MFMQLLDVASDWQTRIVNAVNKILVPVLVIGCSVGMIWAIVVGIKMMKADDKAARDENKAKLINIAISIVAIAVLIGLFYALKSWLTTEGRDLEKDIGIFDDTEEKKDVIGGNLLNTARLVKQCASMMFFGC